MRFGILVSVAYPGDFDPGHMYRSIYQQAEVASKPSFESLFAAHHYLMGPDSAAVQPLLLLANLTGNSLGYTSDRLSSFLPLHQFLLEVAEHTATLDILSQGKFLFGVAQGYRDVEFQSFGIEKRHRRERLVKLQVIRQLWRNNVTFHGQFFHLNGVSIAPKPIQRPGPPILVGADTLKNVLRVPEVGDHWVASGAHQDLPAASPSSLQGCFGAPREGVEGSLHLPRSLHGQKYTRGRGADQGRLREDVPDISAMGPTRRTV